MDRILLQYLACPKCGSDFVIRDAPADDEIIRSGILLCENCKSAYPIANGVPRLNEELEAHRLTNVARTFGYEWKAHHHGNFESETLFGRTREQDWELVREGMRIGEDVRGAVVLDAGCGSGRFCQLFAEHGASVVIGVDMNEAVDDAAEYCKNYPTIHIVQGNIFSLPFKREIFDLIWCSGVIHHTPDAGGAHRSLAKHVKPRGILYVWVYPKRFNPFRLVKRIFDVTRLSRLPPQTLEVISKGLAYPSLGLLWLYQRARSLPGLTPRSAWGTFTVRSRTLQELQLTWFDALSPEFETTHTEAEVIGWFRREGFEEILALEEPKIGVRGVAPASS